jgi:DHA2 family methylenomycin A resistance protein-like MFS transporter
MIPPTLFASPVVPVALIIAFVSMAAFYGVVFLQSLYFQELRGVDAFTTGLLFLPMTALVAILNPSVAKIMHRYGLIVPTVAGQALMATGLIGLALLPPDAPLLLVAALMVPVGVGGSFTVPPLTAMVMDHVPDTLAGTASGVLSTARQMGGSLGVAIFGAVIAVQPSFTTGLRTDLSVTAAILLLLIIPSLQLRQQA